MLTLITNAHVFAPEDLGHKDVLIAGSKIAAVEDRIDLVGVHVERIDAEGRWLLPGFVDALCHPCGGGGEGGFGNRTPEMTAEQFIRAGVTTPVGALGTDSIGRSLDVLYGTTMKLRADGLDAYMYTGAYRVPSPTLTGDIARDITLIDPVIGVGEVAIADHRGSEPTVDELRRIAADARLGGVLTGQGGTVLVHVGDGPDRLAILRRALEAGDLPAGVFYPTHVNRSAELLEEAAAFAKAGNYVDITASTTPELIAAGDIPALEAFERLIALGAPAERITMSSDAGGSLPRYENGELKGISMALPQSLPVVLSQRDSDVPVARRCASLGVNAASALGLPLLGSISSGSKANLLLIEAFCGSATLVLGRGRVLQDGTGQILER